MSMSSATAAAASAIVAVSINAQRKNAVKNFHGFPFLNDGHA